MLCTKELLSALNSNEFDLVDLFASAVVTLAWITLCILI